MDPLADAVSLSTLPAAAPAPIDAGAFEIFAPFYESVMAGMGDVINNGVGTTIGYVHEIFVPICTIAIIFMAIIEVFHGGAYFDWLIKYVVRGAVVLMFVDTAADYSKWVVTPIQNMGDNIAAALAGTLPGANGHIFDVLMAKYSGAVVQTVTRLPFSSVLGALESIVLAGAALFSWVIAFAAVGVSFAVFLIIHVYLSAILIVGPIFIALAMAGTLRNWLVGYLNAVASQVLSLVLLGVGLTILTRAEEQILQSILAIADNVNFWSSLGHLFGGMVALCIGSVYAVTTRTIAVGIVGGVYAAAQPYVSAARSAMAAGAGAMAGSGGSGSSGGVATPAMAIPMAGP